MLTTQFFQVNLPKMSAIKQHPSRHFLPMPSMLFGRTKSCANFKNDATSTSTSALAPINEEPDETMTALPTPVDNKKPKGGKMGRFWRRLKFWKAKQRKERKEVEIGQPTNIKHTAGGAGLEPARAHNALTLVLAAEQRV
jgi:hypothetical protein